MSTDQNTHTPGGPQRTDSTSGNAGAPQPRSTDGFLNSLSDLESRISAFKALHEQATARDMELTQRERVLAEREAGAAARAEAMDRSKADLDRQAVEIVAARRAATDAEARATAIEKDIAQRQATLEREEADLAERERAMAAKAVRAEAEMNRAAKLEEEVEAARRELDVALAEIARREAETAERAASVVHEREAVDRQKAEAEQALRAREESMRVREGELREGEFDLAAQRDELARERAGVSEQARALAEQMKAQDDEQNAAIWSTRMETMQMEIGEAKAARARLETELSQTRDRMEALTNELIEANQQRGVPDEEVERRDKALEEARARLEESRSATRMLQSRIDAMEAEAKAAASERTREIEEREDQIKVHRERLVAHSRQLDAANLALEKAAADKGDMVPRAEHQRLEQELAAARELLEHAEAASKDTVSAEDLRRREADIAGLEQALKEAERAAGDLAREELQARDATIADLRAQLAHATQSSGDSVAEGEEIAKRDEAITILSDRLQEALAEASDLRSQLEAGGASVAPSHGSHAGKSEAEIHRRERLRRYKSMLQTQARKIMAAQSALQRRHTDCELVLNNRARLVELAQQLSRAEKRVTSNKARSGAAAAMLYMVATLVLLAGLSWEVSKRIWPGTYIARAVIEADTGRRTPKPEDLVAWQKDHSAMLSDPRLMEMTADRMARRGLPTLGTPAELASRMKEDMYVQPGKPGSLTVELRGEGAEKSALVLDTLITSFKSFADQAREERSNDIGVIIAQAAAAGAEPLMDKRLERAGGVFGGAALAAGLAGLVIWSRLVRAKKKFDQAAAVEAALQEVDWTALEASIRKHSGKDSPSTT